MAWAFKKLTINCMLGVCYRLTAKLLTIDCKAGCECKRKYTWPGSNWRPSACEADVIATRPQVLWNMWRRVGTKQTRRRARRQGNISKMVPRGLEPRTLRLLAARSNQLSYETCWQAARSSGHAAFVQRGQPARDDAPAGRSDNW